MKFAKTLAGLEAVLADELRTWGATHIRQTVRGVEFEATDEAFYACMMNCRTALRFLVPIAEAYVENEAALYEFVKTVPWWEHFRRNNTFAIDTLTLHDAMNHGIFLSQKTKDGLVDVFRDKFGERPSVDAKNPDVLVHLYLNREGKAHLYLDASGRSLNQRGYRDADWKAPLNEVLAAGLILLSGWDGDTPFVDPMCGSGTLLLEAALIAKRKAPGLVNEEFGIRKWPTFRSSLWSGVRMEALNRVRRDVDWIWGSDIAPEAVAATKRNLRKANLTRNVNIRVASVEETWIPPGPGLILTNPPYGERIGTKESVRDLIPLFQQMLKTKARGGYKVGVFTGDPGFKRVFGLKEDRIIPLKNGPLDAELLLYTVYDRRRTLSD